MEHDLKAQLSGDASTFSSAQRRLRARYLNLIDQQSLPAPLPQWLENDAGSQLATAIYNTVVDAAHGERIGSPDDKAVWLAGDLADILATGGDAELWTLLRIGLDEAHPHCARAWADRSA